MLVFFVSFSHLLRFLFDSFFVRTYARTNEKTYVRMYVCTYVRTSVRTYTHARTHLNAQSASAGFAKRKQFSWLPSRQGPRPPEPPTAVLAPAAVAATKITECRVRRFSSTRTGYHANLFTPVKTFLFRQKIEESLIKFQI